MNTGWGSAAPTLARRELLRVAGRLVRSDAPGCRSFPFRVPPGVARLGLVLHWEPWAKEWEEAAALHQALTDNGRRVGRPVEAGDYPGLHRPKNFLTLALYDPLGYRGTRHRLEGRQVVELEAEAATPGYEVRPLVPGRWRVVVAVRSMVSRGCCFELAVWGQR